MIVINEKIMDKMGEKILGTQAKTLDKLTVRVAGLVGLMSYYYQNVKKIVCDNCLYEWGSKDDINKMADIRYMYKGVEVCTLTITKDDVCTPNEWLKKYEQ